MDDRDARAVAAWRYEPPYDFYDTDADEDDLAELLDAQRRRDVYFAARDETGALVGFFCLTPRQDGIEIGLGLRPDLTGQGLGLPFLLAGLEFAGERLAARRFALRVAAFNQRAIRVYERAGFRATRRFRQATNGGMHDFVEMVKDEPADTRA
jgi:ribosomal-protein-alanine N-acetyltransferase